MNKVLEKFELKQASVGTFTHLKSITAIEAVATAGMDYVIVDMEHAPISIDETARYMTAADAFGITGFVRVSDGSRTSLLRALDVGAKGIIVPFVQSLEQARELVAHAKFAPTGNRGYCMTRDGKWGFASTYEGGMNSYMQHSNREALLLPQCETIGCFEQIEQIAALDGIDGIMVGPYDLSIAMGMPAQFDNPKFKEAVARILAACHHNNKLAVIFCGSASEAKDKFTQGFDSAIIGLDVLMLINGYRALVDELGE